MKMKVCSSKNCQQPRKSISEFSKAKNMKDGLQLWCKECVKEYHNEYYDQNKIKIAKYHKEYNDNAENKIKRAKYCSAFNAKPKNKERKAKYDRDYYLKNREKIRLRHKDYNTRLKVKNRNKERKRNRSKIDLNFRLTNNLRNRIRRALIGYSKSLSTMFLIGCDIDYLMYHLQEQFTKGMSWDNYGDWHIDHIKSCAKFDLSKPEEQRKCFNYTNLQPLWAIDNWKKGSRYDS